MRVGIVLPRDQRQVPAAARWAEDRDFDFVACGEHVFFHASAANAFVVLAAAAGATEKIRLLSTLTILPVYPAVLAAKLVATIDHVSNGRFDFGVGIGGEYPPEFSALNVPVHERGARTDEALEVIARLLGGERVDFDGRWTCVGGLALNPAALQQPRPPVWIGGRREGALRRAGRFADIWMPYLYTPELLMSSLESVRSYATAAGRQQTDVSGAIFCWGAVDRDPAVARRAAVAAVNTTYNQDFEPLADRYLLTGTPQQVTRRLVEYRDAGAETVIFGGPRDPDAWWSSAELLADEVLPAVHTSC